MRDLSDTLRSTFRRVLRLENRRAAPRAGNLHYIRAFESKILGNTRDVTIYLPPGYEERPDQRYPVLYMHDGQNLFEPHRAFIPGQHWQVREAADAAIAERTAAPIIIVGVDNGGADRIDEYTPTRDEEKGGGGRAGDHAQMLIEELKPVVDAAFRTRPEPSHTALAGSSLGGLATLHVVLNHPDVFGRAALISPSVWWDSRVILREVEAFKSPERPRLWLDMGGREGVEALAGAHALRDKLRERGWTEESFHYHEDPRGDHSERAWARRTRMVLEFLFPLTEF